MIVVDPPRKGCEESLLATMIEMQPKRIVYVSCDSATLARDLKYLCERGYELRKVCPVDQFGGTVHVETIEMQPKRIVYVSCDSATLARDLKYLCERGYELRKVCPVDQFGGTVHVETVVLLSQ